MSHFMMRRQQVFHVDTCALLNPEIFAVIKVPRTCVADHVHVLLLRQDRFLPECVRHSGQIDRLEEALSKPKYTCSVVTCSKKYLRSIIIRLQIRNRPYKTELQSFRNQMQIYLVRPKQR